MLHHSIVASTETRISMLAKRVRCEGGVGRWLRENGKSRHEWEKMKIKNVLSSIWSQPSWDRSKRNKASPGTNREVAVSRNNGLPHAPRCICYATRGRRGVPARTRSRRRVPMTRSPNPRAIVRLRSLLSGYLGIAQSSRGSTSSYKIVHVRSK